MYLLARCSVVGRETMLQAGKLRVRAMALWSTQPLTERSTWNLPGGKGRPAHNVNNLTAICEPIV
jgi:hypothetical protein